METRKSKQYATCARCGATLTNPVSVALGIGPICRGKGKGTGGGLGGQSGAGAGPQHDESERMVHLNIPLGEGLVFNRLSEDVVATNVPWLLSHHSPGGFDWGYAGSGPSDLALNVAEAFLIASGHKQRGRKKKAQVFGEYFRDSWAMHHQLKERFIVGIPKTGGVIPYMEVMEWVREWLAAVVHT